jgi:hypothetical protein
MVNVKFTITNNDQSHNSNRKYKLESSANKNFWIIIQELYGMRCLGRVSNPPLWDTRYLYFQNPKKSVLLWKMSSRFSQLHYIRFLYLNFIMLWLILCVKNDSYLMLMENRCKMAIKHLLLNMNVSNLHFLKNRKYDIQKLRYHLNIFVNGDLTNSYWKINV